MTGTRYYARAGGDRVPIEDPADADTDT